MTLTTGGSRTTRKKPDGLGHSRTSYSSQQTVTTIFNPTDHELLEATRLGHPDAFGTFYVRYRRVLLGYLARQVQQPEVAADLMAEAFASALSTVRATDRPLPHAPAAWLFAIARNLLTDSVRRGRVDAEARRRLGMEPTVLGDEDLQRITEIAEATDVLRDLSGTLPDPQWEALRAHILDDEPYPDMAKRLRCSEAVVRKRVSRARAHLRAAIGDTHA